MSAPKQPAQAAAGVFVDAVTGRHATSDSASLLQRRCLTFDKNYGWTYDVWVDDVGRCALLGAHSRFSVPAIGQRIAHMLVSGSSAAAHQLQQILPRQQQQQQHSQHQA
eukprot:GHRQ01011066.1.p2 GENE.GHRQ01011066.1~~GHRQ01011066.1.p2  ORF type:complete len:109 (+),score=49.97 GHRQ01011066.1:650-976(+)